LTPNLIITQTTITAKKGSLQNQYVLFYISENRSLCEANVIMSDTT